MSKEENKKVSLEEHNRLKIIYAEELKRKDKLIEKLTKENMLLLKSALKQSEKNVELNEQIREKTK